MINICYMVFQLVEDYLQNKIINCMKFKISSITICCIVALLSCTKQVTISPIAWDKNLLVGTGTYGNSSKLWELDSSVVNGKTLTLTTFQKQYVLKLNSDSTWSDSDGFHGIWSLTQLDKITITTSNFIVGGSKSSIDYAIDSISSTHLAFSYHDTTAAITNFYHITY